MKELTLMNRYHQIQGRPKPPVEQRVKVMDTLDKKMESILEREDLSTNSSTLVFIVFGTLSNIFSSIASFVSVSITAGGDVDTLDTTGLGL
jgi:hypothetical protein